MVLPWLGQIMATARPWCHHGWARAWPWLGVCLLRSAPLALFCSCARLAPSLHSLAPISSLTPLFSLALLAWSLRSLVRSARSLRFARSRPSVRSLAQIGSLASLRLLATSLLPRSRLACSLRSLVHRSVALLFSFCSCQIARSDPVAHSTLLSCSESLFERRRSN